jgi:hypothetical protein
VLALHPTTEASADTNCINGLGIGQSQHAVPIHPQRCLVSLTIVSADVSDIVAAVRAH